MTHDILIRNKYNFLSANLSTLSDNQITKSLHDFNKEILYANLKRINSDTVMATRTVLFLWGSKMSAELQTRSSRTPILRQAEIKFSTLRRHFAGDSLGTAGEGTWIELTDLGET